MSKFLFPTEYYDSTYSIDFEHYYRLGYRAVLFDIDNTLVPHDFPSDERSEELLHRLMTIGFRVCFVSITKNLELPPSTKRSVLNMFLKPASLRKPDMKKLWKCLVPHAELLSSSAISFTQTSGEPTAQAYIQSL